jgi:hypothetical protein
MAAKIQLMDQVKGKEGNADIVKGYQRPGRRR